MKTEKLGQINRLYIADFGVSKAFGTESLNQAYTKTGTIGYMPPEVANSVNKKYDSFAVDGNTLIDE